MNLKDIIAGKKTYLTATISLIALLIAWSQKKVDDTKALEDAIGLILVCTIRHGVSTAASASSEKETEAPAPPKLDDGIRITLK